MKIRCFDIKWDTDGEEVDLPTETILEVEDDFDLDQETADALSDKFGWCVLSVDVEDVTDDSCDRCEKTIPWPDKAIIDRRGTHLCGECWGPERAHIHPMDDDAYKDEADSAENAVDKKTAEETLKDIAGNVSYAAEENEDSASYDENYCIDRETLLGILDAVRWSLSDAGIEIPVEG